MDLQLQWFFLLGVLLTGYAILDGFDLGVGILHLAVARTDKERRLVMNSIGPLWDGNEVWLVTFGGALFAAFPEAYQAIFSGFYIPFMLLLFALIFRGVSMEFRSKEGWHWWRTTWDLAFSGSSALATLLFGVAVGNAVKGLPLNARVEYQGSWLQLLGPYPILVGLFTLALFALHGALYLYLKTEGAFQERIAQWVMRCYMAFLALYAVTTGYTLLNVPNATHNFTTMPWIWGVVGLHVLLIANIPRAMSRGKALQAFLCNAASIGVLVFFLGMALYPDMIVSSLNPEWNLSIHEASSSQKTLTIMRLVAIIGMPFVLAYSAGIYWIFRGKVELGKFSY